MEALISIKALNVPEGLQSRPLRSAAAGSTWLCSQYWAQFGGSRGSEMFPQRSRPRCPDEIAFLVVEADRGLELVQRVL